MHIENENMLLALNYSILKERESADYITSIDKNANTLLIKYRSNKEIKFEIPQGEKGEKGEDGKDGLSIIGPKGKKGDIGPKGEDGLSIVGPKGEDGKDGTIIENIYIDQRGHLIIITTDKRYDLGRIIRKQGGGMSPFAYTNEAPTPFKVGGLKIGTRFQNVDQKVLWTRLLYGCDLPSFTSFVIEGLQTEVEIGYPILAGDYLANFNIDNALLLKKNTIAIYNQGTLLLKELPNSSPVSITIASQTKLTTGSINFEITAFDTTGTSFNQYFSVNYFFRIYYGEFADDINEVMIPSLRVSELKTDIKGSYLLLGGGYKWFCYPEILGENYVFYDVASDIVVIMDDVKKLEVFNEYGIPIIYNCYRTLNEIHDDFIMMVK